MKPLLTFIISVAVCLGSASTGWGDAPRVAPAGTMPQGQTYGRWAAEWWQWAVGVPAANNPVLDETGADCGQRQVGDVWFLAGSFGTDPVMRECAIPAGKALFIPLINSAYFAFLNDPPETRTEEAVREFARCTEPVTSLSLVVDGFEVPRLAMFHTGESGSVSPIFNVQLPPGNLLGADESIVPELVLSPSAEEGYYVFLAPLSVGSHSIQISAEGCFPDFSQDIAYDLEVIAD